MNSLRAEKRKAPLAGGPAVLYDVRLDPNYNDITTGANGSCALCSTTSGYDYVTGLGSPKASSLIPALVNRP